jgi:hypothetical protein
MSDHNTDPATDTGPDTGTETGTETGPNTGNADSNSNVMISAMAGLAGIGVGMLARSVLNAAYRKSTGNPPPNADDLAVPLGKALMWTVITATTGAVVELVAHRTVARILESRRSG